ncbi:MAG TPA: hypothetical protein VHU18_14135 [Rhizomicrobium sp.]|jgi:hypothetical protein|nr:hypothetical protein [Rhizomicrobium sp.]
MIKTVLFAGVAALALTGSAYAGVVQNAAGVHGVAKHVIHAPPKGLATLYDQNIGDSSYGFFSQTLSSYPQYDEYLADDFKVPAGHSWKVKEVDVTGFYYIGAGPASSVNVLFWKNKGSLPKNGDPKVECDNITPSSDVGGTFQIKLPKTCKVNLKGGTNGASYWVTVQANMKGINTSGYWAWTANLGVANNQAAGYWYGGSVGVNDPKCLTQFESISDCTGSTVDFAFALLGKDKS